MFFWGECEFRAPQGCGNGEGEEDCERGVVVSKEESGVKVSERLRLRLAMLEYWGVWCTKGLGICGYDGGNECEEESSGIEAIRGWDTECRIAIVGDLWE